MTMINEGTGGRREGGRRRKRRRTSGSAAVTPQTPHVNAGKNAKHGVRTVSPNGANGYKWPPLTHH
jgi:hypothetical protein